MALKVRLVRSYHCSRWWVDETDSPQLCDSEDVCMEVLADFDKGQQAWQVVDGGSSDRGICISCAVHGRPSRTKIVEKITRVEEEPI